MATAATDKAAALEAAAQAATEELEAAMATAATDKAAALEAAAAEKAQATAGARRAVEQACTAA